MRKAGELYQDTRASTAMTEFRGRKMDKQKKFEETNFGPPKPFDMSFIEKEKVCCILCNTELLMQESMNRRIIQWKKILKLIVFSASWISITLD